MHPLFAGRCEASDFELIVSSSRPDSCLRFPTETFLPPGIPFAAFQL
jgi:hypothetical protein